MVPWRGGDSQRALSCIDKLRTKLNWPQRLKPPYFWACHRTAEAVRLTTPASGAGRGPRSKAFAPQVRNSCAKRNDHRASRSRTAQMTSSETAKWLSSVLSLKLSSKCCHPEPTRMTCFFNSLDGKAFQDLCRELQRQDTSVVIFNGRRVWEHTPARGDNRIRSLFRGKGRSALRPG